MRILSLETSSSIASVAVMEDQSALSVARISPSRRVAQSLAKVTVEQLNEVGWRASDIQLIAVSQGPGSFTGLRVGVTFAKTLAYSLGAELIGVSTLEAIAQQAPSESPAVWAVIDAQRQQLFSTHFRRNNGRLTPTGESSSIVDHQAWLDGLTPGEVVTGGGLQKILDRLPVGVTVVDHQSWIPQAETVGAIAWRQFQAGRRTDLWQLTPLYGRKSAAEEKLELRSDPSES